MTLFPLTEILTRNEGHAGVERTHMGQAHIAGTGPEGRTCRECKYWYSWDVKERPYRPYRGGDDGLMHLEPSKCRYSILNKAERRVPHHAQACRLFEQNDSPPPITRERKRKAKKN